MGYIRTIAKINEDGTLYLVDAEIHSEGTRAADFGPQRRYETARIMREDGSTIPSSVAADPNTYYAVIDARNGMPSFAEIHAAVEAKTNEIIGAREARKRQSHDRTSAAYAEQYGEYAVTLPFTDHRQFPPRSTDRTFTVTARSAAFAHAKALSLAFEMEAATIEEDFERASVELVRKLASADL